MRRAALLAIAGLVAAGCGGGAETRTARIVVATLGDSITAGSPGYDPDPAMRDVLGFGANERSQWQYWAERKEPRLRFRNCGVYGQRTAEIARRLGACAAGAHLLVVQGGINDLVQGVPVEQAATNLHRMVARGKALGLRVEVADLLPWNNGWPDAAARIRRLNRLIRELARAEGVRVLPFYGTLEDPRRPGRMAERLTADGDHPSVEGYRLLGERAAAELIQDASRG